jgi:NitT/TauT family transport system substrate-binding protein
MLQLRSSVVAFAGFVASVAVLCLAAPRPATAEDVLVTQYKADPSGAPFAVAIEKGFFKKAGIDITGVISGAGGGASVRAAMASALGYGDVSPAPVIAAIDQGQDLRIVNLGTRLLDLNVVVMPNSSIKSIKDLKGKKFGISNPKSLGEMVGVLVLEKAGLHTNDMKMVPLGSLTGAVTALEKGVVDVTAIPTVLFRLKNGASRYRVILGPQGMPHVPPAIGIATGALMKNHPDKLRALIAGRREGVKYIYEHTDDAIKILTKLYEPLPPDQVAGMVHELVAAKFWSEGKIEMDVLENTERAMKYVGMLNKPVDLNKMVNTSFLPSDLQK